MAEEWFRSPDWDDTAQVDFEARLGRARPHNRQQYLRIKGLSLRAAGHLSGAVEMLERAANHPGGALFESVAAWETLGDMAVARGECQKAELLYRRILAVQTTLSGTTGSVEISLAEILLDRDEGHQIDEAAVLLTRWVERAGLKFNSELFRWQLALIRLAEASGDSETVKRAATDALTLAGRGPQLPGQPDVGLVRADRSTLRRLRKLSVQGCST